MTPSPFSPHPDPFLGRVLKESYHLDRKLSENGMGAVYLGTHLKSDRMVAVKTLHGLSQATQETCARFFHEARILSKLDHPHIVRLMDFDFTPEGLPYLVMEYMEGCTLEAFVPPEGLPFATVLDLMQQILKGVGAAHEARLIHRDLAPFNLFVADPSGHPTIKILNFGVAKALNDSGAKTFGDSAFGNPNYMSPEHFRDAEAMDARSDIFSLGSILHFLITGQDPFPGTSFSGVMSKVLSGQKPTSINFQALGKPECAVLEPIIRRAMSPQPELRYASTDDMLAHLAEVVAKVVPPARGSSFRTFFHRSPMRQVASFTMGASPLLLLTGGFLAWQLLHQADTPHPQPSPAMAANAGIDPSFTTFQDQLRTAVKARDAQALLAFVSGTTQVSSGTGPEAFSAQWHPEQADSTLWTELEALLAQPDRFAQSDRVEVGASSASAPRLAFTKSSDGLWRIERLM